MRKFAIFVAILVVVSSVKVQAFYDADPQQCIEQKCPNQWAACQKDSKCIPALQDCQKKCGTKTSCWTLCLPSKGSQAAIDVAKCAQKNNCLGMIPQVKFDSVAIITPQDCIKEKCPSQLQACQKDNKCFPALQDCEKQCTNNSACWTTCLSKKGDQAASDLYKCILDNNCFGTVAEQTSTAVALADPQQCIEEKCPNEWAVCLKDPKCVPALQDCQNKCGTKVSCWTLCLPGKGSQAAIDVAKCAQKNNCLTMIPEKLITEVALADPQQCIEEKCPNQWAACQKDSKCIPALQDCQKKCGTKESCWTLCLPSKGSQAAIDVAKCAQANKCLGQSFTLVPLNGPQECIQQYCKSQEQACVNDRRCIMVLDQCDRECNTSLTCWDQCLGRAKNQNATNYIKCIIEHNCLGNSEVQTVVQVSKFDSYAILAPQDCIQEKCPSQLQACQKDNKCFPALAECERQCANNSACWTTCLSKKGDQAASDLYKCILDNNCFGTVAEQTSTAVALADPQQCIEEKCPNEWAVCLKDPKCVPALQDCQNKCGTKVSCWTLCLPGKGSQAAIDVAKCAQKNNCLTMIPEKLITEVALADPQQCIEEKCPNQWAACQKDSKCIPALQDCQKKCGTKESCWTLCLPSKGSQAAIDVAKCAQANKCLGQSFTLVPLNGPQECIQQYCKSQEQACVNDRRCIMVLDQCDRECNTSLTCWDQCLGRAKNQNATNYIKCIIEHNCLGNSEESTAVALADPQQCIEEKCPNEWAVCLKDPKCIPALQDCQNKCGTKVSCWTLCLPGKGSQAAIDVAKCAQKNNCLTMEELMTAVAFADPQQCIQEKCPNQYAACLKDSKCTPALNDCEKKCGNSQTCWTFCLPGKGSQAAIDVAKCAAANKCLGLPFAFENCMDKSCFGAHLECLSNWDCRNSLRKCRTGLKAYDFELECLSAESKISTYVAEWYACAGESFCL